MSKLEVLLRSFCKDINESNYENEDVNFKVSLYNLDKAIRQKAFKEVLFIKYKSYYNTLIDAGEADDLLPILKELRENQDKKFKSDFLFITINPYENFDFRKFIEIIEKSVKKPWIKKYMYVIEQRGETEDELGKGFHTHMLIDKGSFAFSTARREFLSSFKRVCDTSNFHCFNFAMSKEVDIPKRVKYMIGQKADENKWKKQEMDKVYRRVLGLKEFYGELF